MHRLPTPPLLSPSSRSHSPRQTTRLQHLTVVFLPFPYSPTPLRNATHHPRHSFNHSPRLYLSALPPPVPSPLNLYPLLLLLAFSPGIFCCSPLSRHLNPLTHTTGYLLPSSGYPSLLPLSSSFSSQKKPSATRPLQFSCLSPFSVVLTVFYPLLSPRLSALSPRLSALNP